jgi:hypothetical protein
MSFRGRIFTGSLSYPSDAGRFMAVAGGGFTTAQKRALGYLVNNLADLGIGAPGSNFLIYPFIGGSSAKHALNLFYPEITAYNLTFVGSPTQGSAGTTFNGTTQYATAPSLAINPLTPNLTTANISYGVCTTGIGAGTYIPIGYFGANTLQTKTYSTAASYIFNPNAEAPGITSFTIAAWGGGGAGGGSNGTTGNFPGGGGAGGGYASNTVTISKAQGASDMSITVGLAGTANSGAAGGVGGDSIVSHPNISTITAKGGPGGNVNPSGAPGAAVAGAAGNSAGTGGTTSVGGAGAAGGASVGRGGGGGGSSAGTASIGGNGTTPTTTAGGAGGTPPTGGVAGGAGGNGTLGGAGFAGNSGNAGGGGGGGAGSTNSGNNRAGGAGGVGKVTVAWTMSVFKRNTIAVFDTGAQQFDCSVNSDNTSRYQLITAASLNGVRVGSRRGNAGTTADMGFYINNSAASTVAGPAVMTPTSYDPSPVWYIGAANSWGAGLGNNPVNFYSGDLNFAFMGPAMTDTQLQAMYTLITTYNTILGR